MAQSATVSTEDPSGAPDGEPRIGGRAAVDVRSEHVSHTRRILDLQIEGSRTIYRDALGVFLVDVLALVCLLSAAFLVAASGGLSIAAVGEIGAVLLGAGTLALFVSMAYALQAYLGDAANYSSPVTDAEGEDFLDKSVARNVAMIKQNAEIMEAKVGAIQTALLALLGGLGGLALVLGFQLMSLSSWAQALVSVNALIVIGYLLVHVTGLDYLDSGKERLLR